MAETVGRYVLHEAIARGGMATVHAARLTGAEGFHRLVAAKRLHPEFTEDPEFVTMFHDEARIASRIHHPNVVPVLDVVVSENEVMLVQEYVHGVPLSVVMRKARQNLKPVPTPIAVAIVLGVLSGLHAAHEAKDELGTPLNVIHRDVSPQNVMLSTEGVPRLLDFGIAKARTSAHQTRPGVVKGKLSYMAPEQIKLDPLTRRADVYATGVVLWELLANRRIGDGMGEGDFLALLFEGGIPTLVEECSAWRRSMGQAGWKKLIALDAAVSKALSLKPSERFATAQEMADALMEAHTPATQSELAAWIAEAAGDHLEKLRRTLAHNEEEWRSVSRVEAATLSRKGSTHVEDSEADRVTIPISECHVEVPDDDDSRASDNPPTSLSAFERGDSIAPPPRRILPFVAAAAIVFGIAFAAGRQPVSGTGTASVTPPPPVAMPLPSALTEVTTAPPPEIVEVPVVSVPPAATTQVVCAPPPPAPPPRSTTPLPVRSAPHHSSNPPTRK